MKRTTLVIAVLWLANLATTAIAQDADYPLKALREHREGISYYKVTVGTDGRAKNCTITQSSGSADLDKESCRMMVARGRWSPKLDAQGQATEAEYPGKVSWKLPN